MTNLFNFLYSEINVSHHLIFELIQIFSDLFLNKYLIFFGKQIQKHKYNSFAKT